ncbi:hypothetical protein LTR66_004038, partial [Elasticomyces elasticus]
RILNLPSLARDRSDEPDSCLAAGIGAFPAGNTEAAGAVQVVEKTLAEAGILSVREEEGVFGGDSGVRFPSLASTMASTAFLAGREKRASGNEERKKGVEV